MTVSGAAPHRIVGRERELALLVDSVTGPDGHGAVVSGPTGVGKSALVRAACDRLAAGSMTVHAVRATRAVATIPFGAFVRFVPTATSMPVHQLEALARLTNELQATAGDGRLLVSVDDAHLLDDSSSALIHSLVDGGAAVLATVRSGEPLADAIAALRKDLGVRHVELGPLDRDALDQLAFAELGGPLDPDLGREAVGPERRPPPVRLRAPARRPAAGRDRRARRPVGVVGLDAALRGAPRRGAPAPRRRRRPGP